MIDESYDQVKAILTERRDELERIAKALIQKETLDRDELGRLLARASESIEVEPLSLIG